MFVKEEFTFGEGFTQIVMCRGAKVARTRFWTVLVLSDDDEDSESEDELIDRVYARGGEKRSKSIAPAVVPEPELGHAMAGAVLPPYGQRLLLGDACEAAPQGASGLAAQGSLAG